MSTSWQLNGVDLDTATVKVVVDPGMGATDAMRNQEVKRLHSSPLRHQLGTDFPSYGLTFTFIGPASDRSARAEYVRNILKTTTTWTLTAPDAPNQVYFNGASKTVRLSLTTCSTKWNAGVDAMQLDVAAVEAAAGDVT